jgi:type III restriction enzyme
MLQEIRNLQGLAVSALVEELKTTKKEITFKAPTGSGKTYMMADFMNRVLAKDRNVIFIMSSLSKGGLARQNYEKFVDYKDSGNFPGLDPYLINSEITGEERLYIPPAYNVYVLPRDLYKKNSRLMQGAMVEFLRSLTAKEALKNKDIILIRDECHVATKNLDDLSDNFHKIINFSATPKLSRGQSPDVEIKVEDAVNSTLIKSVEWGADTDTIGDAVAKFEKIKEDYRNLLGVNPCLIVQISNKDKADDELSNRIMPVINKTALKWMLIVNEDKNCDTNDSFKAKKLPVAKWKDYAKSNTAEIDIIIFKMVISEGWDIPRACMLYQVRDTQSKQLDEQVIGRVRRNPRLLDFETLSKEAQGLAMTAWVWGIRDGQKKMYGVRLHDELSDTTNCIKIKTTRLKDLTEKKGFDLTRFLDSQKMAFLTATSIFELADKLKRADNDVMNMVYSYATDYTKWGVAAKYVGEISAKNSEYKCDYSESMEVVSVDVSFPLQSYYTDNGNYTEIGNWVWEYNKNDEGLEDRFSFDSEAERRWAVVLIKLSSNQAIAHIPVSSAKKNKSRAIVPPKDLFGETDAIDTTDKSSVFLWGKNYVPNSAIKFEYYMDGVYSSYPDFVMKDKFGRIHIFEVKSLNISGQQLFDSSLYEAKIEELRNCYKQASALTDQFFYLPILDGNTWIIIRYYKGNSDDISVDTFMKSVMSKSS